MSKFWMALPIAAIMIAVIGNDNELLAQTARIPPP